MTKPASARELIFQAVKAARYDMPVDEALAGKIAEGGDIPLDSLKLDSLGWMEFCISIEANSGLELGPDDIARMRSLGEVESWLTARLGG